MSTNTESSNSEQNSSNDYTARQPAMALPAAAISAARREYQVGDGDRAPKNAVLPTGTDVHRAVVAGVLTNIDLKSKNTDFAEIEVTDYTGNTVWAYPNAKYNQDVYRKVRGIKQKCDSDEGDDSEFDLPKWVVVVGKPSPYQSDESGDWLVSFDVEELTLVSEAIVDELAEHAADNVLDMVDAFQQGAGNVEDIAAREYENRTDRVWSLLESVEGILSSTSGVEVDLPEYDQSDTTEESADEDSADESDAQAAADADGSVAEEPAD